MAIDNGKKALIINEAINVFKEKRFANGSLSEIARRLDISPSLIYYYFKNKDEIFAEIVKQFKDELCKAIDEEMSKMDVPFDKLFSMLTAYKNFIRDHRVLYDIFREVEFVNKPLAADYYKELSDRIVSVIAPALKDDIDYEAVSYAILGSVYFVVLKNLIWDEKPDVEAEYSSVKKFLMNGIDVKGDFTPYILKEKEPPKEEREFETRGEKTRCNLVKAAEKLFGEKGYNETQIADIVYRAKVGLGTFYIYFKSKKEILRDVVKYINHTLRKYSWLYFKDFTDRREVENAGMQAFFYLFKNKNMGNDYRVVREAEFVDKEIGTWYYKRLASSYEKGLIDGIRNGEIIEVDPVTLSYILMGIGHTVGIKWFVLDEREELSENSILSVLEFMMHGLHALERSK